MKISQFIYPIAASLLLTGITTTVSAKDFVQDAEYYVLEAQHGDAWAAEDKELAAKVEAMRAEKPTRDLEIAAVRIADALFWGVPAEFFQAFAIEVRDASPFRHTCCVELANGYDGYICTKAALRGGGYEVRTARSSFLDEDTGEAIVGAMKVLCREMYADAESEIKELPKRRVWPASEDSALDGIKQLTDKL